VNALATALDSSGKTTPRRAERIYVGLDVGYREHVAAACPLQVFNVVRNPDGWKRVHTIHFASDAAGFGRFQRYLDRLSNDPDNFLILLEPTGSYGLTVLLYPVWARATACCRSRTEPSKTTGRRSLAATQRLTTRMRG